MDEETQRPEDGAAHDGQTAAGADAAEASRAWTGVVAELDALGEAIGRWAKAAANDPENRRRLDELGGRLEGFMSEVGSTIKHTADSEVGQSFREAAEKTGEAFRQAGERVSEEMGPRLASAFKSAAERLGHAAERMEGRAGTAEGDDAGQEPSDQAATGGGDGPTDG